MLRSTASKVMWVGSLDSESSHTNKRVDQDHPGRKEHGTEVETRTRATRRSVLAMASAAILLAIILALFTTITPARAAFPGKNGPVIFESNRAGNWEIYSMSASGGNLKNLTKTSADERDATLSPDGKKLAFDRNGDIFVKTLATGATKRLTFNLKDDSAPAFSPDGKRIAFTSARDDNKSLQPSECRHLTNYNLYVMNADGSGQKRVGNDSPCGLQISPDWSPDGKKIAFESYSTTQQCYYYTYYYCLTHGTGDVYTTTPAGTGLKKITSAKNNEFFGSPSWSPSGKQIVFEGGYKYDILKVSATGGTPANLTKNSGTAVYGDPAFSADGTRIAYTKRDSGKADDVFSMAANGSAKENMTRNGAEDQSPYWGRIN